ncbi:MAG: hypothetical protein JWP44_3054 [Mucilaginibacter sp.]|nr:hypothetical protein [Mucilaginibacter sp.]
MTEKNKRRFLLVIYIFLATGFIVFGALYILSDDKVSQLQYTIDLQNITLRDVKHRDSIYTKNNEEYSKTIKKYTSIGRNKEVFSIGIGKKDYTIDEFIKLYGNLEKQKNEIKDSLNYFQKRCLNYEKEIKNYNAKVSESNKSNKKLIDSLENASRKKQ